jgi:hypothetical protein
MKWSVAILAAICLVHVALLTCEAISDSPVQHEPANIYSGLLAWSRGRYDVYRVNPPLVRTIAALPLYVLGYADQSNIDPQTAMRRPELYLGATWMESLRNDARKACVIARIACFPFSLLGAAICYVWSKELFGLAAGLLALLAWCLSPTIVGHGHLAMPDVAAGALAVASAFTFSRWRRQPNWRRATLTGITIGLAQVAKFTSIVLLVLVPYALVVVLRANRRGSLVHPFLMVGAMLGVINASYAWDESFSQLGSFEFVSEALSGAAQSDLDSPMPGNRFRGNSLGLLPVPLPRQYLLGIDEQRWDFEVGMPCYMAGKTYPRGWIGYYAYAALVKEPLGLWLLAVVSMCAYVAGPSLDESKRTDLRLIGLLLVLYFLLVSLNVGVNRHYRYAIPAMPFAFILISRGAMLLRRSHYLYSGLIGVGVLWMGAASLAAVPHSLAYFNEAAGGSTHGHEHLLGSNLDWGQDLLRLQKWLQRHPAVRPVEIDCDASYDPAMILGEDPLILISRLTRLHHPPEQSTRLKAPPQWLIMSVNRLTLPMYAHLDPVKAVARIGTTLLLFDRKAAAPIQ